MRATNFDGTVPIEVVLVPSSGDRLVYEAELNMITNLAELTVDVEIPANTRTRVWAWTR